MVLPHEVPHAQVSPTSHFFLETLVFSSLSSPLSLELSLFTSLESFDSKPRTCNLIYSHHDVIPIINYYPSSQISAILLAASLLVTLFPTLFSLELVSPMITFHIIERYHKSKH